MNEKANEVITFLLSQADQLEQNGWNKEARDNRRKVARIQKRLTKKDTK